MSTEPTPISSELNRYIQDHAGGRDEVLRRVERETAELGSDAMMQTAPEQAAVLEMLVRLSGAKRAVEVGTFTGYAAIRIAEVWARAAHSSAANLIRNELRRQDATWTPPA